MSAKIQSIIEHYEACLEKHGDSHLGVDWPNANDAKTRYRIMLDVIKFRTNQNQDVSLLDFGCGTAHLYEYILEQKLNNIQYSGLDISEKFLEYSRKKHPNIFFICADLMSKEVSIPEYDFIVMNGVFTEKRSLDFDEMWEYTQELILKVFSFAKIGLCFNVMSKHVDWERDDLFHLPHDTLCNFLCKKVTRNYIIRNDYGLYEYSVYIYK
jgi:SAM-dependent methyltransferase